MEEERKRKRSDNREDDDYRDRKTKKGRSRSKSPRDRRDNYSSRHRRQSKSISPEKTNKRDKHDKNKTSSDTLLTEVKKEAPERKKKETDMLNTRTGGAYIPPARLRMMQAQITDKSSVAYQRLAWEALKKSIHGHINKINVGNIGIIIKELLKENIVRGRGLLCRSVIQAQAASSTFTNVYAALVAAVNSRFPNIGELLLKRLVIQFKRGFKRNDKAICISSALFIAHLVNQKVAHEILALELLTLLVETPTDDSVEVAIAFLKECGQKLTEVSSKGVNAIFEMLRNILHEGQLEKRVQYMIEVMFQVWKDGFKDHPAVIEELELVPEEEQFTHLLMLDDATDPQDILNVFKFDEKYEENEDKYKDLSKEILGSDAESGDEEGSGESGSESEEEENEDKPMTIIDNTETNLVALRRTIYLTINSSLDFEECAHKLMKMQLKPGQEVELCHMFLDCCAEQRTYEKFYGLLAQRFCNINRMYIGPFEEIFKDSYSTAHRLDTNRLRNVSKFFAHLFFTDSISWEVLDCVKLNEEDTTSSSRIYIKILFQELAEYMGLKKLNDRLKDPTLQVAFAGIFPRDNPKNTRFSINFFTSIGLGGLTDELREHLKQMPKNVPPPVTEIRVDSSTDSSSSSSESSSDSSDSSSSESDKEEANKKRKKDKSKKSKSDNQEEPKTTEGESSNNRDERWGHDGFYDTYGADARRHETKRSDRDKDNFVRPRDVPRKNGNNVDRYRERHRDDTSTNDNNRDKDRQHEDREPRRYKNDNNRDKERQDEDREPRRYYDFDNYRDEGHRSDRDNSDSYRREGESRNRRNSENSNKRYNDIERRENDKEHSNRRDQRNYQDDFRQNSRRETNDTDESRYDVEESRNKSRKADDRNRLKEETVKARYDSGYDSKTREKARKDAEKSKRHKKKDKNDTDNSSDEESERDKKGKRSKRDRKNKEDPKQDPNEWDIKRASSIRRELPSRYWDSTDSGQQDERS